VHLAVLANGRMPQIHANPPARLYLKPEYLFALNRHFGSATTKHQALGRLPT
jgi:hypothetical protein